MKIKGEMNDLWRAVDHEGEVLESFASKTRDKPAALKLIKKLMSHQQSLAPCRKYDPLIGFLGVDID